MERSYSGRRFVLKNSWIAFSTISFGILASTWWSCSLAASYASCGIEVVTSGRSPGLSSLAARILYLDDEEHAPHDEPILPWNNRED